MVFMCFLFQAEDGIRDLVRSRGLGDVYKRQAHGGGGALTLVAFLAVYREGAETALFFQALFQHLSLIHI